MLIAILVTDNADSAFARRHPHDGEKFRVLMQQHRPDWNFETIPVKDDVFPEDVTTYDGYVVAGSPASVNDDIAWINGLKTLVRELHALKVPLMGTCFGHQAIAAALGGTVGSNPSGWALGVTEIRYSNHKPWMDPAFPNLRIHSAHNEQVLQLPPDAELLASDPVSHLSSFSVGDHIFTTQHHPEFEFPFMDELLVELDGSVDAETISRARSSLDEGAQGNRFAEWMVRFFELER